MLLLDTSAWIEYLRATGSPAHHEVRRLLRHELGEIATTQPIVMELLAGAGNSRALDELEKLTSGLILASVDLDQDFHAAAAVYRAARRRGQPVRKLVDCLIAAVAARTGATLVHRDRDFDTIAAVLPDLRTESLR
ncbi:type II toxin-antitoxin system VapC family toxin [Gandjariella thermophila]|uniref:Ribonuclease VapC n=1 Tax=Gandjariella thermophila TaxID=1931992 RepID=A0A4D4J1I6_9PSEU|nr:PIN domain nuclease [Gandjariella thermophila]GDY30495.1 ribonuclease VapC11 [Gandjariella thermophila]